MPRARGEKRYINLLKGLNTEESPLEFPVDASVDEQNMVVDTTGRRRRRRQGIRQEETTVLGSGESNLDIRAVTTFEWINVAENNTVSFLVTQAGDWLSFLDITQDSPVDRPKDFSYNLTQHKLASASTNELEGDRIQMDSIKGQLIVVGQYLMPFRLKYNPDTDVLVGTPIFIRVRDIEGVDDALDIDERPGSLSEEHQYNLYNQGWYEPKRKFGGGGSYTDPVTDFFSALSVYPSNADIVYLGSKVDTNDDRIFDPKTLKDIALGNSTAPRGHYVFSAFDFNRESRRTNKGNSGATSGISSDFPSDVIRPVL